MIENSKDALHYIKILVNGSVISTQAARTARRFILAYGDPVDYNIVDYNIATDQVLCIDWDWNYRVKIKDDGSIDFADDVNAEIPLNKISDNGWFASVHNALEEAATVAPQTVKKDGVREINFPTMIASNQDARRTDKTQVSKMLGKASELSAAVSNYKKVEESRKRMADALADELQALANLVDAYQLTDNEITEAIKRVTTHNKEHD